MNYKSCLTLFLAIVWSLPCLCFAEDGFTRQDRELLMQLNVKIHELEKNIAQNVDRDSNATILGILTELKDETKKRIALETELKRLRLEQEKRSRIIVTSPEKHAISTLHITSNIGGAAVYIDKSSGRSDAWIYRGTVPFKTRELTPGKHIIKLSKPGYEDVEGVAEIISGKSTEIGLWMVPSVREAKPDEFEQDNNREVHQLDAGA